MIESFYIGAYWFNRPQTAQKCAADLLLLIDQLKNQDPVFSQWFLTGSSRVDALRNRISLENKSSSQAIIEEKANSGKRQAGDGVIVSLWNGLDDENASGIRCSCGAQSTKFPNNFVLTLPYAEDVSRRLLTVESVRALAEIITRTWNPQWLKVSSDKVDDYIDASGLSRKLGWATYISGAEVSQPCLPETVCISELGVAGKLVCASADVRTFSSSALLSSNLRLIDAVIFPDQKSMGSDSID